MLKTLLGSEEKITPVAAPVKAGARGWPRYCPHDRRECVSCQVVREAAEREEISGHSTRSPRYACETCRDSGEKMVTEDLGPRDAAGQCARYVHFIPCPACDGKSRLCGEIDDDALAVMP
jgi:hypothetical protein